MEKELHVWAKDILMYDVGKWESYDESDISNPPKVINAIERIEKLVKNGKKIIFTNQIPALISASDWLAEGLFSKVELHTLKGTITFTYNAKDNIIETDPIVTWKELRPAHNLFKMYVSGAFDLDFDKKGSAV